MGAKTRGGGGARGGPAPAHLPIIPLGFIYFCFVLFVKEMKNAHTSRAQVKILPVLSLEKMYTTHFLPKLILM